ncbi:hypothetical protein EV204_11239 [Tissierella praeacuta]|uniref:hypothetical protein n=1 Tax=Tissierella praeacuta TaxID=43131 RepID=UPI001053A7DF|nr:hypothetical protein [Tissierella praeacuta]TCU67488.1 hypothetical protein EV204_11239 [Tissierella praeacuta]
MQALIESIELICSPEDKFDFDSEKALIITSSLKNRYPETMLNQDLEFLSLFNKKEKKSILISSFEIKIDFGDVSEFQKVIEEIIEVLKIIHKEFNVDENKTNYSIHTDILRKLDEDESIKFMESINKAVIAYDFSALGAEESQTIALITAIKVEDDSYIIGIQPYIKEDQYYAAGTIRLENAIGFINIKNKLEVYKKIIDNSEHFICSNFIR